MSNDDLLFAQLQLDVLNKHREMVHALEAPHECIQSTIDQNDTTARLLHAAMGCVTEAGEFMDQMKKHIVYNQPLDRINIKEELGDQMWYIMLACNVLGVDFFSILERNMEKLAVRFPGKFDFEAVKAENRSLGTERDALEGK